MLPAKSSTSERQAIPQAWVERIFDRLLAFYGAKLADAWRGADLDNVKRIWAEELAAYSKDEIAAGVAGCRGRDWPPTLPEFLKLCRPPIDAAVAWHRAQLGARERADGKPGFTSPVLFEAYRRMAYEIGRGEAYNKHADAWKAVLQQVQEEIAAGLVVEITAPPLQLPEPPPLSAEEAKKRIAEMRARFGHFNIAH